jgi:hypothetical protein
MSLRTVEQPTCISLFINEEYLLIKDLNGKNYICPLDDPDKIGKKILSIAKDLDLPISDVKKIEVSDEDSSQGGVDMQDFILQNAMGFASEFLKRR